MFSYRHGYHAGNFADVLKHSMLIQIIKLMKRKDKPIVYIDTHAGAGEYTLSHEFAQKTGEYKEGIARLWEKEDLPDSLRDYIRAVKAFGHEPDELHVYPGSPSFVQQELRKSDRMLLHELHGTDYENLQDCFTRARKVKLLRSDGLQGLISAVPPLERRGVILIDPSYEIKSDYEDVVTAILKAHKRFSNGVFILWYPVVNRELTEKMLRRLAVSGIKKQLRVEQSVQADSNEFGMTGAGLLVINPPWKLDEIARETIQYLGPILSQGEHSQTVKWEVKE